MAIADTIQSMYDNVGEVYDTITNVEVNNGTNLLDYSTCKIGDLNTGTGAEETSTVRIISDFVEVTPNENYICTLIGGDYTTYYYKSDKTFISGGSSWIGSGNSFTTPNNTGYLRLKFKNTNNTTISLNDLSNVMLNKGSTALPYQPYTDNPTNKNIENIPSTIRKSYLDIMNNGIDTIYDNWEKVNGTGTSISLNSTEEAPMKINLKGNTSQATLPSGYTAVDYIASSGTQYIDTGYTFTSTKEKIDFKYSPLVIENARVCGSYIAAHRGMIIQPRQQDMAEVGGLSITPSFSISANTDYKVVLEANNGNYSFVFGDNSQTGTYNSTPITNRSHYIFAVNFTGTATKATIKLYYYKMYDNDVLVRDYVPCYRNSDNEVGMYDLVNNVFYTNAGTGAFTYGAVATFPNPDYPQDIHVVSGDNSIEVVGKNLAKSFSQPTYNIYNDILDIGIDNINALKGQTITISFDSNKTGKVYENENFFTTSLPIDIVVGRNTITRAVKSDLVEKATTYADGKWRILKNYVSTNECIFTNVQLELSNQATTYQPYQSQSYPINLGNIELCKIGDYQDSIKKSTGKNLFDSAVERKSAYPTGNIGQVVSYTNSSASYTYVNCCYVEQGKTYTISWNRNTPSATTGRDSFLVDNENKKLGNIVLWNNTDQVSYTPGQSGYLVLCVDKNTTDIMINEGTTALPYEPYGKVWYLNKQIGKVVLNGSESGWSYPSANRFNLDDFSNGYFKNTGSLTYLSNYYEAFKQTQDNGAFNTLTANTNYGFNLSSTPSNYYTARFKNTNITSVDDFKTWLSTHNTTVYYVLATPTYTEITDSTLISQLETVKRSYNGQTNITQTNNDKPFILDATALKQLTQ